MNANIFCDIIKSMKIRAFIAAAMLISSISWAAEKPADSILVRDAKEYIETIEKVSKLKIDDQIDVWQTFLSDHPKNTFRKEIEKNIEVLQSLSQKKPGAKQGDEKEAELYLKALEFSKKLNQQDQIALWEQFLEENPNSIYKNEAQTRLMRLKRYKPKAPAVGAPAKAAPATPTAPAQQRLSPTSEAPATSSPKAPLASSVGGKKPTKDEDQALMLASLAGLVVPGMGHWYTEDYVIAGVLSAVRIAGLAIGIPGVINSEYNQIYLGGGLAILSYAIDIADAPYSARRFNEKHSAYLLPQQNPGMTIPLFAYSINF